MNLSSKMNSLVFSGIEKRTRQIGYLLENDILELLDKEEDDFPLEVTCRGCLLKEIRIYLILERI